jgi:hypothetical protein
MPHLHLQKRHLLLLVLAKHMQEALLCLGWQQCQLPNSQPFLLVLGCQR